METIDDLQLNGLRIIQGDDCFKFGMDAVLLSEFADIKRGAHVTDLGTGTGILPILLCGKTQAAHFFAVEIQDKSASMAQRSVELNNLSDRITVLTKDMKDCVEYIGKYTQDAVVTNPPYIKAEHGSKNINTDITCARHEMCCNINDVVSVSEKLLKPGGTLYMVHRPDRLTDVIVAMRHYRIEPKIMRMVVPYVGKKPNIFLIKGVKGAKESNLIIEKDLVVYNPLREGEKQRTYTEEVKYIYDKNSKGDINER